ncbi:MAG TPA: tetratricopeptide repeat protein [Thermodesulfobacteriota bacterium]|nr:tetratricopeptide repeat protein [Thermodesulfobacteriota bacterium]
MRNSKLAIGLVLVVVLVAGFLAVKGPSYFGADEVKHPATSSVYTKSPAPEPQFTGGKVCARCHQSEYDQWLGSHHDLAMQEAEGGTVLGDFGGAEFDYYGRKTRFYMQDDKFMVETDGPDGKPDEYEIKYTFGVYPLQQYLVEFPGGRLQTLGIAWDSRPAGDGGQRWFHLYPDREIVHTDTLHWTGIDQNWNHMCAECHSTDLRKNYDLETNTYKTSWSEIDVSCEACHGPGSEHVKWAESKNSGEAPGNGLVVNLGERKGVVWNIDAISGNAIRSRPIGGHKEVDVCAQCHSRRSAIAEDYFHGESFLDSYMPSLLDEGVYYPDGQIQAEDYEYGSFVQSKMYHEGVTCSDCHNPHSLELRAEGNALCGGCHSAAKYDTPMHHNHEMGSAGANCAACHMSETMYMQIDGRRDHSIRMPRPDLTVKIGVPNACGKCHADRSPEWAASEISGWKGSSDTGHQDYAEALHAGRTGEAGAEGLLGDLAGNESAPSIARATALKNLGGYLSPSSLGVIGEGLKSGDSLMRGAALDALYHAPPETRLALALPLLKDPVLGVRIKAASVLAGVPKGNMTPAQVRTLSDGFSEFVKSQMVSADRPESHINLGLAYTELGQFAEAEESYKTAMRLSPSFAPAYVNLADLYRMEGRDAEGEGLLRKAIDISPENADAYHALGLLLIRRKNVPEAMNALSEAVRLNPENARYSYVYAVALNETGKPDDALTVLEEANSRNPNDRETLYALTLFNANSGDLGAARRYAEKLHKLSPDDPAVEKLLNELSGSGN